jgi:hypothetical protein
MQFFFNLSQAVADPDTTCGGSVPGAVADPDATFGGSVP